MLYILWGITSVGLLIAFIALSFKATSLIGKQMGRLAAVIFGVCLLSFTTRTEKNELDNETRNLASRWGSVNTPSGIQDVQRATLILEDNLMFDIKLLYFYGYDTTIKDVVLISAAMHIDGTQIGTEWEPRGVSILKTEKGYECAAKCVIKWKVLGNTFGYSNKAFIQQLTLPQK